MELKQNQLYSWIAIIRNHLWLCSLGAANIQAARSPQMMARSGVARQLLVMQLTRLSHSDQHISMMVTARNILVGMAFLSVVKGDLSSSIDILSSKISPPIPEKTAQPCDLCRLFVSSFEKGLKRTARGKFEGGDARWEESRLGSYQHSEIRLVEIQEMLCSDAPKFKDQCHHLAEESESIVEDWWFNRDNSKPDLMTHLCINERRVCCPANHFGPSCSPCPSTVDGFCNERGSCDGNGTRSGTGQCNCATGYSGELCTQCSIGFYSEKSSTLQCEPCDTSCHGSCSSGGSNGCDSCKSGYTWTNDDGCVDINECLNSAEVCPKDSYCTNTLESYNCNDCDKSCASCHGGGANQCSDCAPGYVSRSGICTEVDGSESKLSYIRYTTYIGLTVCTVIISRSHLYLASVLGCLIAVYIAISEYTFFDTSSLQYITKYLKNLMDK